MWKPVVLCVLIAAVESALLWDDLQVDTPDVQSVVNFVAKSINDRSNSIFMRRVSEVVTARRQMFLNPDSSSSFTYEVKFLFAQTKCNKYSSSEKVASCDVYADRDEVCTANVAEGVFGGFFLRNFQCNAKDTITKRAGGIKTVVRPEIYLDSAVRALSMANSALKNIRVVSAKTQVVAGQKIMLEVVGDSSDGKKDTQCSIDIWSRPWLADESGFQVTKFVCNKVTSQKGNNIAKRAGGIQTVDKPEIYLDSAVRALSMANSALKNIRVVSAKTQVVAGQKIMLEVVGDSSDGKEDTQCSIDIWSRPWLANEAGFQVTKFFCSKKTSQKNSDIEKRAGGIRTVDKPEIYLDSAVRALSMANSELKNIRVVSAKTQVVAGQKIMLEVVGDSSDGKGDTQCSIDIWSRPWLADEAGFQVTKFVCNKVTSQKGNNIAKRAGGVQTVDKPEIYLDSAVRALSMANSELKNIRVVSAKTQVVAGQKIMLEVVGDSSDGKEDTQCSIDIWSRPWLADESGFRVTKFVCNKVSSKKGSGRLTKRSTGGIKSVSDPSIFTETAIRALSLSTADLGLQNVRVVSAKTQVVSGQRIYLEIVADAKGKEDTACSLDVWSRPWLGDEGFIVNSYTCKKNTNAKSKRALGGNKNCPGCVSDVTDDLNNYMGLYVRAFGLASTNMDVNNIEIEKVQTQVVAGIRYIMTVKTTEAGKPRRCTVTFVMQPWMAPNDMKNVNFDCKPIVE